MLLMSFIKKIKRLTRLNSIISPIFRSKMAIATVTTSMAIATVTVLLTSTATKPATGRK